ncbi:S8 family serine peptidase [Clostridium sp. SHJSY1]|uniref:S8 family serine peptidase n=1 Tax=Clostridium sp. SHJSY1 TaxID=2942483 RepID=UPI002875083B|nr:S8 family serine peptidase [Clostridium sp. SHJSY1]MDS0527974.1 S8 family serine peptidase [Clostridium sp. SHJSY1]
MFFHKNKLDKDLKYLISNNCYKYYRVLIKYKHIKDSIVKKISSSRGKLFYILEFSCLICAEIDAKLIDSLLEYPEVEYIGFDDYLFLCGMSVSTANSIHISEKYSLSGKGVGIGIVDSGVYPHPDLLTPTNRINLFKDLINNLSYPYDDNGHGTCICGLISSSGISSNNLYKGIAPHSSLYCYKAFDALGKGYTSDILFAIEALIKNSSESNIRILCLPFEMLNHNTFIIQAFNATFLQAINKGITPIVPSGSTLNSSNSIMGIATLSSCITVGGIDTTKSIKPYIYSSSGHYGKISKPDLCAAAVNISSLNANTSYISEKDGFKLYPPKLEASYKTFKGTSLSVAFICGLGALLYENNPSLSFKDFCSILKLSCEKQDFSSCSQGEGVVNISKLLI